MASRRKDLDEDDIDMFSSSSSGGHTKSTFSSPFSHVATNPPVADPSSVSSKPQSNITSKSASIAGGSKKFSIKFNSSSGSSSHHQDVVAVTATPPSAFRIAGGGSSITDSSSGLISSLPSPSSLSVMARVTTHEASNHGDDDGGGGSNHHHYANNAGKKRKLEEALEFAAAPRGDDHDDGFTINQGGKFTKRKLN